MNTIAGLLLLLPALQDGAVHEPDLLPKATLARFRVEVDRTMTDNRIPGLSIAVVVDGKLAWADGFGLSDVENRVPAKAVTSYRWASVSKAVTAMAVMQLVEQGKLRLEEDIRTYVPEYPKKEKGVVTVRDLLCHQSGVRHYKSREEINSTDTYRSLKDGVERFKADPLRFKPGTAYAYTTYGYTLLGRAVETVSGLSFTDYLKRNVFIRAGMHTARDDSVFHVIPNRAQGYVRGASGLRNSALTDTSYKIPGGGLCGSAVDLGAFLSATLNHGLIRSETFKRMAVPQKTADGRVQRHGLGWTVSEVNGRRVVSHGGAQQRVSAWVAVLPRERLGVAVVCNLERMGGQISRLAMKLLEIQGASRLKSDF